MRKIKRFLRESYKDMESSLSRGYSFVFLIKDHSNVKDLTFENIKLDMERIFKETELIVMEKK